MCSRLYRSGCRTCLRYRLYRSIPLNSTHPLPPPNHRRNPSPIIRPHRPLLRGPRGRRGARGYPDRGRPGTRPNQTASPTRRPRVRLAGAQAGSAGPRRRGGHPGAPPARGAGAAAGGGRPVVVTEEAYRPRAIVGQVIGWLRECRRVATRYERVAVNYLAMVEGAIFRRLLRMWVSNTA